MGTQPDFPSLLTRRADKLLSHLSGARRRDAEEVHRARVAARRLVEALSLAGRVARGVGREVRGVRQALGTTRDLDVTGALFDELASERQWPRPACVRVRRYLGAERARRDEQTVDVLRKSEVRRLRRHLRQVLEDADDIPASKVEARLRRRIASRRARLARAVEHAGVAYDVDRLHDVRRAIKKLRYVLELAKDDRGRRQGREIGRLKAGQILLGRLHDLQVLEQQLRTFGESLGPDGGAFAATLAMMRDEVEAECRRLHGTWLLQRVHRCEGSDEASVSGSPCDRLRAR